MSNGKLTITGNVLNTANGSDIPNWISLADTKAHYASGSFLTFISDAKNAASLSGISIGTLDDTHKLVIIYAGNIHFGDGLNPVANSINGTTYIMSERNGNPINVENGSDAFGRIGVHCHEFGHLIGIGHTTTSRAGIMDAGRRNGPVLNGSNGSAPAPLSPTWRIIKGWLNPISISGRSQRDAYYSLTSPTVYKIVSNSGDTFLIENRRFDQTMVIGSTTCPDYNNSVFMPIAQSQNSPNQTFQHGVFVWRISSGGASEYSDNGLIYASGVYGYSYPDNNPSETDAGNIFSGTKNVKLLAHWTDSRNPFTSSPPYNIFVTNTKPGTNVGMEILTEYTDHIKLDLFSSIINLATTISSNQTLNGVYYAASNVTVNSGVTLTIQPNTKIYFANNASLIVNGTLNAAGSSSQHIVFTSQSADNKSRWGTVIFNGSSTSSSMLNYVDINYGTGIQCNNGANITIQHSKFYNCTYGIYVYNSEPQIINNQILEPQQNGIYGEASGLYPLMVDNTITKTTASGSYYHNYQGLYFTSNTRAFIAHNDVSGFYWGAYIGGGAVSFFTNDNFNLYNPNNRFRYNLYGFAAGYGSYIWGGTSNECYNSCYSNSYYDVKSYQNSSVYAQNNYWGGGNPRSSVDGTSYLYITPIITSPDPWGGNSPSIAQNNDQLSTNLPNASNPFKTSEPVDKNYSDLLTGISLEKEGKIDEAMSHYKEMVEKDIFSSFALTELFAIKNKYSRNDILGYLANIKASSKCYSLGLKLIADNYLQNKKFDEAINIYDKLINSYSDEYQGINARFEKLFAYINIKNDEETAKQILTGIIALNLKDDEWQMRIQTAEDMLALSENVFNKDQSNKIVLTEQSDNNPKEFSLLGNYPNPFNPTTTISYNLPRTSDVELKIYDILGNEVKTFFVSSQSAGTQNIVWNGTNNYNEHISSGIYIYRFKAVSREGKNEVFVKSAKLIMLK